MSVKVYAIVWEEKYALKFDQSSIELMWQAECWKKNLLYQNQHKLDDKLPILARIRPFKLLNLVCGNFGNFDKM